MTNMRSAGALLWRWVPVGLWMGFIFFLSAQPSLPQPPQPMLQDPLSRAGHLGEYMVLAWLLHRALGGQRASWRRMGFALAIAVLYAVSDEFHQSFVPHRDPSLGDVMVDILGASLGLLLASWLSGLRKRARWDAAGKTQILAISFRVDDLRCLDKQGHAKYDVGRWEWR